MVWRKVGEHTQREKTALELRRKGFTLVKIGERMGVSRTRVGQILAKAARTSRRGDLEWARGLTVRAAHVLYNAAHTTVERQRIKRFDYTDPRSIANHLNEHWLVPKVSWRYCGPKTIKEILEWLEAKGHPVDRNQWKKRGKYV